MVSPNSSRPSCEPVSRARFELLTLGDELLLGLTPNSHLTFIGSELARRGVSMQRNIVLTDDAEAIARELRSSWAAADVVIMTGGLGPTCDDRTRETVASVLGQKLVFDPQIEKAIAERFARFGRRMTPNNLKQAYRFERGEVLPNPNGTAPGLWVEQDGKVLCMLPGPPNELQPLFVDQVLPRLASRNLLMGREAYVQLRTSGIGESMLETKLQPIFDRQGGSLGVAFCAHSGHVDCRLSSPDGRLGMAQLEAIAAECAGLLGEDFVCYGHDSLAKVCADQLRAQEKKLAVAEAGTGGLLCNAFAGLCGSAKFFAGGCVCAGNDSLVQLLDLPECLLQQHGAVSAECAVAMATGAAEKMGADWAVAIVGYGSQCTGGRENPVGTIYLALHAPHGIWSRQLSYPGPRSAVRQRAVNAALDWIRRELVRAATSYGAPAVTADS